ncbi:MAG TPA: DUF3090 family protein [Tepidiformaceae bacterium]|nr:DUF3090 family protein [Tepidiformaceae bacterium]
MSETRELGPVVQISAEAIGQPGQRRFRLQALSAEGDSASLWLEKEQLVALGEAIENVLKQEGYQYQRLPLDDAEPEPVFPLSAQIDFQLIQLSMGVNRETQRIVLIGADSAPEEDDAISVTMEIDYRRGYELRRQIADVVSAGRPPCPLCGAPLDPSGHICPRSNGHHPQ